jgi:hypothetical protein
MAAGQRVARLLGNGLQIAGVLHRRQLAFRHLIDLPGEVVELLLADCALDRDDRTGGQPAQHGQDRDNDQQLAQRKAPFSVSVCPAHIHFPVLKRPERGRGAPDCLPLNSKNSCAGVPAQPYSFNFPPARSR